MGMILGITGELFGKFLKEILKHSRLRLLFSALRYCKSMQGALVVETTVCACTVIQARVAN